MSVSWAIERFKWRFTQGHFKGNEKDIKALNAIIDWVNIQKDMHVNQHKLFCKLYIKRLCWEIYRTSNYKMAVEAIERDLRVCLDAHIHSFRTEMILHDFEMASRAAGMPDEPDYTKGVSVEERKAYCAKVQQVWKDNEAMLNKTLIAASWTPEKTRERLNDLLSDMIHYYADQD